MDSNFKKINCKAKKNYLYNLDQHTSWRIGDIKNNMFIFPINSFEIITQ